MTRVAAGAFGFLTLIHILDGPERYGAFSFFETIPSAQVYKRLKHFLLAFAVSGNREMIADPKPLSHRRPRCPNN